MKRKSIKADPFDVWGLPPQSVINKLTQRERDQLRCYVTKVTDAAYRVAHDLGYDNGLSKGLTTIASVAHKMLNSR